MMNLHVILYLWLILHHPPHAFCDDACDKAFMAEYVAKHGPINTPDDHKKLISTIRDINQKPTTSSRPRVFPFCVGKDPETGQWDPRLGVITDFLEKLTTTPTFTTTAAYNSIEDSIQKNSNQDIKPRYLRYDPRKIRLHYWVNFQFDNFNADAFYIQAIQGPHGLPFGEFNISFETKGRLHNTGLIDRSIIYPCTYYPRGVKTVPKVFMFHKDRAAKSQYVKTNIFSVTFTWTETECEYVPFFQLLIAYEIYHESFKQYEVRALLSDIYFTKDLGFYLDGIPTTIPSNWINDIYEDGEIKFFQSYSFGRIVSNLDFEKCMSQQVGLVKSGAEKGSCPPGPFKCDVNKWPKTDKAMMTWKDNLWKKWSAIYTKFDKQAKGTWCNVTLPPVPTTTIKTTTTTPTTPKTTPKTTPTTTKTRTTTMTPGTTTSATPSSSTGTTPPPPPLLTTVPPPPPTEVEKFQQKMNVKVVKVEHAKKITHGDMCILVWLVIIPIANFISRYFKEFKNWKGIGIGFWITAHFGLHQMAALITWISFGLVVSDGKNFLGNADAIHNVFACLATIIQHIQMFSGFVRSSKRENDAVCESLLHALLGYAANFFAMICIVATSHLNHGKRFICCGLVLVHVISVLLANAVEKRLEKRIENLVPPRKKWPVLERVIFRGPSPFRKTKMALLILIILVHFGLYAYMYKIK